MEHLPFLCTPHAGECVAIELHALCVKVWDAPLAGGTATPIANDEDITSIVAEVTPLVKSQAQETETVRTKDDSLHRYHHSQQVGVGGQVEAHPGLQLVQPSQHQG